jgi:polyphosphate kinase
MIENLYRASQAGVPIEINVRSICCLIPGLEGVSDTIRVVSVVGRYLEHSRAYSFKRGDEARVLMGSADLMGRNLDHRVELIAPVEDAALQAEVEDTLERCFADDTFSWELASDGTWSRRSGRTRSVHAELMERAIARARGGGDSP